MTSVKVIGAQRVANRYRRLVADHHKVVEPVVKRYAKELQKDLKRRRYPPRPPGSTYTRTGRLGSSWSAQKIGKGSWGVQNSASYSPYVVDESKQAEVHQGRWFTLQEVERKKRPELTREIVQVIEEYASD